MATISNKIEFVFENGAHKGEKYYVSMSILCKNPMCRCTNMLFKISDREEFDVSTYQYTFYLDVTKKKLFKHGKIGEDQITKNFVKSFISSLKDDEWDYILSYFRSSKAHILKDNKNLHDLKFDFSSLEYKIESDGKMVIYRDIFPFSDEYIFDYNNKTYLLVDYYCLNSSCKCQDVFFVVCEVHDKKAEEKKGYSDVLYNYSKGTWENESSINGIMKELKKRYPNINSSVKKRHQTLRTIYKNYLNENTDPDLQLNQHKKIGRNDPCICGSGKKYKKCCG